MREFGITVGGDGITHVIEGNQAFGILEYRIEPDLSSACYFYAMAPLLKIDVLVRGVFATSRQGDLKFLEVLEKMGCAREATEEGIRLRGSGQESFKGVEVDMQSFSDQTMTLAAIAPFAETPTMIKNVAHIRQQESDRLMAIVTELRKIGVECELIDNETGVMIRPLRELLPPHSANAKVCSESRLMLNDDLTENYIIETYEDHRMAMAFTLVGLKTGKVAISNPACCAKTFAGYFELIEELNDNT
jgi:3-phosphoshikimate 1-carboxyvinyltransferase